MPSPRTNTEHRNRPWKSSSFTTPLTATPCSSREQSRLASNPSLESKLLPPRAGISPRRERTGSRRRLRHENLEGPKRHPALHPRWPARSRWTVARFADALRQHGRGHEGADRLDCEPLAFGRDGRETCRRLHLHRLHARRSGNNLRDDDDSADPSRDAHRRRPYSTKGCSTRKRAAARLTAQRPSRDRRVSLLPLRKTGHLPCPGQTSRWTREKNPWLSAYRVRQQTDLSGWQTGKTNALSSFCRVRAAWWDRLAGR